MLFPVIKILSKIFGHNIIIDYYRKKGMKIGHNTHIFSKLVSSEPFLIEIGNNCTISTNVSLLTHDASIGPLLGRNIKSDLCGKITIGDSCFIGSGAIILLGVSIPDNCIVAAGSVVTKSIKEKGTIVGGNPAKVIANVDEYIAKNNDMFMSLHGLSKSKRKEYILSNMHKLISK